jgi:hypothetical protein
MTKQLTCLYIVTITAFLSCKRQAATAPAMCKAAFFGYKCTNVSNAGSLPECSFGEINKKTASSSTIATFFNTAHTNQGAYDPTNKCYYTFMYNNGKGATILLKTTIDGQVSWLRDSNLITRYEGLIYNRFYNKLYTFNRNNGAKGISICEVLTSGNNFTTKDVYEEIGKSIYSSKISATTDNKTGNIYYQLVYDSHYELYRYNPGEQVATLIHKENKASLIGLCYNSNDDMLYCIKRDSAKTNFVKISTVGAMFTIDTLPFKPNPEFVSCTFDNCDNEYIISGLITDNTGYFIRLDVNAAIVSRDTTWAVFQGLTMVD